MSDPFFEVLKHINWKQLRGGALTVTLSALLAYAFIKSGLVPQLSEPSAVPLVLLSFVIFAFIGLLYFAYGRSKHLKWYETLMLLGFLLAVYYGVWLLLANRAKPKNFQFRVIENKKGTALDSVYFEIPFGKKGYSQSGIISFDYDGSYDTTFTVKLSKPGFEEVVRTVYRDKPCSLKRKILK